MTMTWRFGDGTVVTLSDGVHAVTGSGRFADVAKYSLNMAALGLGTSVYMAPAGDDQRLTLTDPRIVDRWLRDIALRYRVDVLEAPEVGEWPIPDGWGDLPDEDLGDIVLF